MKSAFDRLSLMQTFVRIVEAGNLSAAAAQLNTTQPTISRRLQALERSLRLTLLHRSTHGLQLTEAGARYYARAKELLLSWSEFESDLGHTVDAAQGRLRIVVPHAFGQHTLVGPLVEFLTRHPQVNVEWLLHDTTPNFIEEGIDCAIHVGEVILPSVVAIRLGEVLRIVVAAPTLAAGDMERVQPEQLVDLPWVALVPYYRQEVCLRRGRSEEYVLAIQPRLVTDSLYALRSAALRGVGAARLGVGGAGRSGPRRAGSPRTGLAGPGHPGLFDLSLCSVLSGQIASLRRNHARQHRRRPQFLRLTHGMSSRTAGGVDLPPSGAPQGIDQPVHGMDHHRYCRSGCSDWQITDFPIFDTGSIRWKESLHHRLMFGAT